jgi:transmembrane sensor
VDQNDIDSILLARYVAGEANAMQRAQVEAWVRMDPSNAQELDRWQRVWSISVAGYVAGSAEERAWAQGAEAERRAWAMGAEAEANARLVVDRAWAKVRQRIAEVEGTGRVIPFTRAFRWVAAAAMLAGVVFAARWWFAGDTQHFASGSAFTTEQLADGSEMELSPGTELSIRIGDKRKVSLSGEAYFEVAKDAAHPFVIDADDVEVTVLGTAFTVSVYDTSGAVLVRVREGRVQVVAASDTLVLGAGDHARFDKQRQTLERAAAPPMERWGQRILQFERAPLPEVVAQLQQIFPVRIELGNPALANCTLTATFEEEGIDRILHVIAETYGLTITQPASGTYLLNGDGC